MANSQENTNDLPPHPAVTEFIAYLKGEKRSSAHTVEAYENDLSDFFQFLQFEKYVKRDKRGKIVVRESGYGLGIVELKAIRPDYVRSWVATLKNDEGYSPRTINRKISSLKSFFKYFLRMGQISKIPMDRVVSQKLSGRLPVYLGEEVVETLFNNLPAISERLHFGNLAEKDLELLKAEPARELAWLIMTEQLLLRLLYHAGIRRAELMGLKRQAIDKARGSLKVLGKGNKERLIPVNEDLMNAMLQYDKLKKDYLSGAARTAAGYKGNELLLVREDGKELSPSFVYTTVKKYLGEVTSQEKRSPHVLRHTFATHLTYHGASLDAVKELLGHSSLAATQVYTHNSIESLKEIHKQAHPKA
ncbi:tyrosine-type recombinase/integrase [Pseudobacter ginsenosidimutans]|uniref:Integrase/recombinase XerC n=1 Tax=Pseudobacter ginsenosidimutans TaxID=661488 RepID=A0A4Q7MR04_9BACT|nr:tyrosine-type recombinase/integrase [Pseudobacter ginsenosidimutans]RZS69179.1 integrase/recombinase XerC [Pseudobacter ginsenosidimutans]